MNKDFQRKIAGINESATRINVMNEIKKTKGVSDFQMLSSSICSFTYKSKERFVWTPEYGELYMFDLADFVNFEEDDEFDVGEHFDRHYK